MPYIRPIIPTVPGATLAGVTSAVPIFGTVTGQTTGTSGVAFNYAPYLERISNALENLCETTYILGGIITPVQPTSALAHIQGTLNGSLLTGLPPASVALMKPGMILTNYASAPTSTTGWFGGLCKVATIKSTTSVLISSQFPNQDGPIDFIAGGYGLLTCTAQVPSAQADIRPGMLLTGEGILPGTFIVDYVAPGVGTSFYVSLPQNATAFLIAAAGGFSAMAHSLSTLEADVSALTNMANNQGIHTVDPYKLIEKASLYAHFAANPAELDALVTQLATLPAQLSALKNALKGVTTLP
jgi:hypothetical protein